MVMKVYSVKLQLELQQCYCAAYIDPPPPITEKKMRFLNQVSNVLKSKNNQMLLCGDFNVGEINWITHEIGASKDDVSQ